VAYLFGNNLFCGDTLFTAGCAFLRGHPGTDARFAEKLMALPDDTQVYWRS
jgi:glyoxylase-like metal-dependent hydrolase (beta-lactamase superfamily II)